MWVDNVASLTTNKTNFRHSTLWMCLLYDSSITLVLTLVLNENRGRTSLTPTIWHSANVAIGPCLNQNTTCRDCASDSTKHAKCLKYLPIADYRESPTTPAIDFTPIVSFSIVCCGKDTKFAKFLVDEQTFLLPFAGSRVPCQVTVLRQLDAGLCTVRPQAIYREPCVSTKFKCKLLIFYVSYSCVMKRHVDLFPSVKLMFYANYFSNSIHEIDNSIAFVYVLCASFFTSSFLLFHP